MTAALTPSNVNTLQFSAGQRTVPVSVMSSVVLISGGRLFHANGPATDKLRRSKPAVLVRDTTRSPWSGESKRPRVETADHRHDVRRYRGERHVVRAAMYFSKWPPAAILNLIQPEITPFDPLTQIPHSRTMRKSDDA